MAVYGKPDSPRSTRSRNAQSRNARSGKPSAARKDMARVYMIRRAIVLGVFLLIVAGIIFGVSRCISSRSAQSSKATTTTSSHATTETKTGTSAPIMRTQKAKDSGLSDCAIEDLTVRVTADNASVQQGGFITFTKHIAHKGSRDCLLNVSDKALALVVSTGGVQTWRSDACDVDEKYVLMSQSDEYTTTVGWNTTISNSAVNGSLTSMGQANTAGQVCVTSGAAPQAAAGDYTAQLIYNEDAAIVSDVINVSVTAPAPAPEAQPQSGDANSVPAAH